MLAVELTTEGFGVVMVIDEAGTTGKSGEIITKFLTFPSSEGPSFSYVYL
jgi:hypothetical protein